MLPAGTVLADRYRIDALLGEGGMGKVYAGEHLLLRKRVALKVLRGDRALVPEVVARFEREAMAAANIGHPNIAEASDFGRLSDGSVFLVLEYVQGRNLRDVVARGPLPVPVSLHIARQIASALAAAQALRIVHRDLKPENVMLIEKAGDLNFVKVLDFGIARVPMAEGATQPLTKAGTVFGTPEYMAPEQALGQQVDVRADLYSLGVLLFEMLAGVRPYDRGGILARQIAAPIPTMKERAPESSVPSDVEALVRRLLSRTPRGRPESATAVIEALDVLIERHGRARSSAPPPPAANVRAPAAPRVSTFLPGDPLPAFELPADTSQPEPSDATTLLRAPFDVAPRGAPASAPPDVASPAPSQPSALLAQAAAAPVRASRARASGLSKLATAVGTRTIALFRRASELVDAHRDVLPSPIRRRLRRVPANVLVVVALGLVSVMAVTLLLVLRGLREDSGSAPSARVDAPSRAEPPAPSEPVPPVTPQSDEPMDPVQHAGSELDAGRGASAIALLEEALTAKPELQNDEQTAALLARAARAKADATASRAFAVLTERMGAKGAEAVYELSLDPSAPQAARSRAERWIRTKDFDRASSPSLYAAARLRLAPSCEQKRGMLKLAANVGGRHALEYLREIERCAPSTSPKCQPCLHEGGELQETIASVAKRLQAPASP